MIAAMNQIPIRSNARQAFGASAIFAVAAFALAGVHGVSAAETSASPAQEDRMPNIVYLFADQLRASAMGYTGNPDVRTPNIDRLADESLNLRNAVAVAPVCTPYRAALLTGRYPTSTGMFLNDLYLPAEELTMAEIFAEAGYTTGYIGKWHLDGHGRAAYIPPERRQGWQFWKAAECDHDNYQSHYFTGVSDDRQHWEGYDAFAQTRAAQEYIRAQADDGRPFVLMVSYGPPHPASKPAPEEFRALYPEDRIEPPPNVPDEKLAEARRVLHHYYAHCTALDRCVGDLLKTLDETGLSDNTIFVFTSDHGGMLWSHGLRQNWKQVPWSESALVPLLLRFPALHGKKAREIDTPLNTTDILPTLLGLTGVDVPGTVEGEDLSPLLRNEREQPDRAALYMSVAPFVGQGDPYRAIRTSRHTYVRGLEGPWLLFDDLEDPYQMDNRIDKPEHAALRQELDKRLQTELDRIGDDFRKPEQYLNQWGYQVDEQRRHIPYTHTPRQPQSPRAIPHPDRDGLHFQRP